MAVNDPIDPFASDVSVNATDDNLSELANLLKERMQPRNYEDNIEKYQQRLEPYIAKPSRMGFYDLASQLGAGLLSTPNTGGASAFTGLGVGFSNASAEMKQKQEAYAKAKQEIGLQAAQMAMQDEQKANAFLDKSLFELAKGSMGVGKQTADITNFNFREALDEEGKKRFDSMKNSDPFAAYLLEMNKARGKREGSNPADIDLSVVEKGIDQEFSKIAVDYTTKGQAQIEANLENLIEKINILKEGEINVSGPGIGLLPDSAKGIFFPKAASYIGDIRDIVFQSLREKLGAQFTEREGDRLVAAAFNSYLDEDLNIARLERLYTTIVEAAKAKEEAIAYFNENRTLKGYKSKVLDFNSIMNSMVQTADYDNMTDTELEEIFQNSDDKERDAIIKLLKERQG
tara:strand:- start:2689 stop:3894 length:1206 start_codon:yes stop_codon:yes gene_type:complete